MYQITLTETAYGITFQDKFIVKQNLNEISDKEKHILLYVYTNTLRSIQYMRPDTISNTLVKLLITQFTHDLLYNE